MASKTSKLGDLDLYGLLDLTIEATTNDIRKAYRKKALQCHPDKNPDNPKAAELFHQLSNALEVLLDESARAAYDKLIRAKEAAKVRHRVLDDKRKKFKEDLEAREKAHFSESAKYKSEEQNLRDEIERLRKEGARLVQEEIDLLKREVEEEVLKTFQSNDGSQYKIKIEWKLEEGAENIYNQQVLENIFKKYGDISALVVSSAPKYQALVEFERKEAAELAMKIEIGLLKNPLTLKWANKSKRNEKVKTSLNNSLINERDYESIVLRNMRQAEERKRLIEELQNEDG